MSSNSSRAPLQVFSLQELSDVGHRPEQLHGLVRQRQEAFPLIAAAGAVILRIDDHRKRSDLTPGGAVERVGQQKPPITLSLLAAINSEPAQTRRRHQRISRQFTGDIARKFGEFHPGRGQCVVAADGAIRQHEHERRRHVLAGVLASLASQIAIERIGAADERAAIMLRTERLDPKRSLRSARHQLYAGGSAIAAHRVAQTVIHGLWVQQRIDKRLAVTHRQFELLVFLNRPPRGVLDAR
jgi:hypothetical protein